MTATPGTTTPGTATTAVTSAVRRRTAERAAVRKVRRRVTRSLLVSGAWFWAIWAAFVAGVPAAVDRWGGEMPDLTYDLSGAPARWVALAVGAIVAGSMLRLHVAAGGTRRSVVDGVLRAAALVGPAYGVMAVLLTLGEERVFDALDRSWQGGATPLPLDTVAGIVVTVLGETFVVVTYALVGVSAVAAFRTRLIVLGPLLVASLLVPCAIVDLATRTGLFGIPLRGGYDDVALGAVGTVVGGLVAAALATVVAHRLLRSVSLRP
ncbi:hypothetical protein GCM10009809_26520 [Isoptericola hypogeus]|uniref:Uncharacterized protein n=1 Tax=Isoptericola hypogeus TaxID=300179 RepID=A0ABN2JJT5_9MICO